MDAGHVDEELVAVRVDGLAEEADGAGLVPVPVVPGPVLSVVVLRALLVEPVGNVLVRELHGGGLGAGLPVLSKLFVVDDVETVVLGILQEKRRAIFLFWL